MDDEKLRELTEENDRLRQENRRLRRLLSASRSRMEFSKLIFASVVLMTAAITVFSCCMIWRIGDTSVLAYLIPAVFAELASTTGFYYNKAKAENKIKLMALTDTKPDSQTFETM